MIQLLPSMRKGPGQFITFEGIEGCGKSTQMTLASEWLARQGIRHVCTREPGGTEIGGAIRKILLSENSRGLTPFAEVLLYLADRFHHISEFLKPKLEQGELVLCDRYHDSTIAYQGYARNISRDLLEHIWTGSGMALEPDHTFLFDIDPETGIARSLRKLKEQQLDESRFEKEALEFHSRVRNGFLELARLHPRRIVVLDGLLPSERIHRQVTEFLRVWLGAGMQK